MKKSKSYNQAFEIINTLSIKERDTLIREIMAKLAPTTGIDSTRHDGARCEKLITESNPHRPDCPHCGAKASFGFINKNGKHKGSQRYQCKACGRKFVSTTGTVFAKTRKSAETWYTFIEMTISGKSIVACAEECNICVQTAFNWRHKILNAFVVNQGNIKMAGNVEVDEMLIPLSYKGNHIQGAFGSRQKKDGAVNDMPRKSYRRGTDNKSKYAEDKACVFCMVQNGDKGYFASVPGVGFMTEPMLDATVAKHINKESAVMLADDYRITKRYFEKNGYEHVILRSNTSDNPKDHKVEVKDGLHIQHVNAMHRNIRKFLAPYCGVSSKYLENYTALFAWLSNIKASKQRSSVKKVSVTRAATHDCYITGRAILSRPTIPACA